MRSATIVFVLLVGFFFSGPPAVRGDSTLSRSRYSTSFQQPAHNAHSDGSASGPAAVDFTNGTETSVTVTTVEELADAVSSANAGGPATILVGDGVYTLDSQLWVSADGVTVRGASGNRDAVLIQGQGMQGGVSHVFEVAGSHFTLKDLTIGNVGNHGVQIHGELDADYATIRNVRIIDTFEQMIKGSYDAEGAPGVGSDHGLVEDCLLEYTSPSGLGPQDYIGGIDVHHGADWTVRGNTFRNIRSPSVDVAEHAVHFWNGSRGTLVERNVIINCDRGIGFGLGDMGHQGGIIRNNMIYHDSSEGFADVGIGLESAPGAQVYNNTLFMEHSHPNAVEYRFSTTTGVLIANNLTNRSITQREEAEAEVSHNVADAQASWFLNPSAGNLHLAVSPTSVVDQGLDVPGLTEDFDGAPRPQGSGIDIGADEIGGAAPSTTPEGIWKDVPSGQSGASMNFYCQTYTTGAVLIIVSPDGKTYHGFLDDDFSDGVDTYDIGGLGVRLSASFATESRGVATLTYADGTEANYDLYRWFEAPYEAY